MPRRGALNRFGEEEEDAWVQYASERRAPGNILRRDNEFILTVTGMDHEIRKYTHLRIILLKLRNAS